MKKICKLCTAQFEITDEDFAFYELISPVFSSTNGDKKYKIPPPTLCPECRMRRRMSFRNERTLYQRKCDLTGKQIISVYPPDTPFTVYDHREWLKDIWDPLDYGRDFDFNRSFFEQFAELQLRVPKRGLHVNDTMVNCDFCNYGSNSKDCYLCNVPVESEKCFYSRASFMSLLDIDGYCNIQIQYSYECISCVNCYELFFSRHCAGCQSSAFLVDCIGCKNCFGSVGLRHQEYVFLNEKLPKKEYFARIEGILSSHLKLEKFKRQFAEFCLSFPYKYARTKQQENCSGDLIINCKNCYDCFDIINQQDSKYCQLGGEKTHHIYDSSIIGLGAVNCYENIGSISCNDSLFTVYVTSNMNCFYCISCRSCKDCFGCEGLERKRYCILNKQYTEEEYKKLVPKIIEHMREVGAEWGEFFPGEISPYAYNESIAMDYFPLTKEQVEAKGWRWQDDFVSQDQEFDFAFIPDDIKDAAPEIVNKIFKCGTTGKPYRVIQQEFDFLKKYGIAIPRKSPNQRYRDRLALQNPYKIWNRKCRKCDLDVQSPYAPGRPEIVYCEKCYEQYYN